MAGYPELDRASKHARRKRQPLSCLACRQHKLRCDRRVPCGTCIRYRREARCRAHPAAAFERRYPSGTAGEEPGMVTIAVPFEERPRRIANEDPSRYTLDDISFHYQQRVHSHEDTLGHFSFMTRLLGFHSSIRDIPASSLPQLLSLIRHTNQPSLSGWALRNDQREHVWRQRLSGVLPPRSLCDSLVNYYLEHINWIFQTVHVPSFRRQYAKFWGTDVTELDLVFTSLVFIIISISALYIPFQAVEIVGCPQEVIRDLAHVWYSSSRSALAAEESEARPCLVQLQVFSITQLYWYAVNDIETLNSCLGRAVRTAQALNMDKDRQRSTCLQDEMRHRLWWDIANADTFQSICLDRPPLIRLQLPGVPLPLNCADTEITDTSVNSKPLDEPTEISMSIFRSHFSRTINRHICSVENEENKSYSFVQKMDADILSLMDRLPWYFQISNSGQLPQIPEPLCERLTWQHHILRTFIGTQRIRMHHPFIFSQDDCWKNCATAAENTLAVYRALRRGRAVTSQQKFFPQAYQVFSVAVSLTTLLMVEGSFPAPNIYEEIKDIAGDLKALEDQGCAVPIATFGRQVLLKLFELYEKEASTKANTPSQGTESLASGISTILDGDQAATMCMERQAYHCDDILVNTAPSAGITYNGIEMTINREAMVLTDMDFTTKSLLDIAWGPMPSEFDWSLFLEDLNNSEGLKDYPSRYSEMGG